MKGCCFGLICHYLTALGSCQSLPQQLYSQHEFADVGVEQEVVGIHHGWLSDITVDMGNCSGIQPFFALIKNYRGLKPTLL